MLNSNSQNAASIVMVLAAAVWGLYWLPLRYLELAGISGIFAAALLNTAPGLLLIGLTIFQWQKHKPTIVKAMCVGTMAGLGFALYSAGIVYGTVVRATLLFYLTPIWSTLIGVLWFSEPITWRRWAAIAIGLGGLALLVSGGDETEIMTGDIFALFSGIVWAVAATLIRYQPNLPLPSMAGAQFAVTALSSALIGFLLGSELPSQATVIAKMPFSVAIPTLLLLPSAVAIFWAQKRLFPGRAGLLMMSEVLVAILSAAILLPDERLHALQWLGATLIVGTFFLETIGTSKPASAEPQEA